MAKHQNWPTSKCFQMLNSFEIALTYKIKGKIIEFTNIRVILELGSTININQNGKMPKLIHRYIFSNVKYSSN